MVEEAGGSMWLAVVDRSGLEQRPSWEVAWQCFWGMLLVRKLLPYWNEIPIEKEWGTEEVKVWILWIEVREFDENEVGHWWRTTGFREMHIHKRFHGWCHLIDGGFHCAHFIMNSLDVRKHSGVHQPDFLCGYGSGQNMFAHQGTLGFSLHRAQSITVVFFIWVKLIEEIPNQSVTLEDGGLIAE
jgi:hypothetical protein